MHILRRYPKMLLFAACCLLAYGLGHIGAFEWIEDHLNSGGYLTVFLAGYLFSFGFTSPFAIGLFIAVAPDVSPVHAAIIGGGGSMLSDMTLFSFARFSLKEELHHLSLTHAFRRVYRIFHRKAFPSIARRWLLWTGAGLVIASPLPDEIAVTMLSGVTDIDGRKFAILSFALSTLSILTILTLAH